MGVFWSENLTDETDSDNNLITKRFFGDQSGILIIDYLLKGQTINAEYYSFLLVQLKDILKGKRSGKVTKVSRSYTTMLRLTGHLQRRRNWPIWASSLDHPPFSPDLAPSY